MPSKASDTKVSFDIPSKVECDDVTPVHCREMHPTMKVVEAKFRISASFVEGQEASAVDFIYVISSPDMRLNVLDFLPNTTLESSTAEDRIEVTDSTENSDATSGDARVSYSLLSIGTAKNLSSKKTEQNRYQKIAPKHLVLASGTVNRGHGVFYKLRPSHDGSLEGAKEFAVLCFVPQNWRGDWCTVVCSARANKKSTLSTSIATAGMEVAHVGLYLSGDREASQLADSLTEIQLANSELLSKHLRKEASQSVDLMHTIPTNQLSKMPASDRLFNVVKFRSAPRPTSLETAKKKLIDVQHRFRELAGRDELFH